MATPVDLFLKNQANGFFTKRPPAEALRFWHKFFRFSDKSLSFSANLEAHILAERPPAEALRFLHKFFRFSDKSLRIFTNFETQPCDL